MSAWHALAPRARLGLLAGVAAIFVCAGVAAWWLLRTDYQALFTDLKPQDAQAMVAELERLKIPYALGEAGTSILVDREAVHATRLKLMGKDLPLHGAVGLELFDGTDFGMTEFAQKINYQRALQGELTRTIQSLAEVRDVRVLLAMPEQGLFRQGAGTRPKASVTLSMRPGRALRADQVAGIQRLVAAAVPGMALQDVTLVDGRGVALTRAAEGDPDNDAGPAMLELKRDTEAYLARKAASVLERSFGAGEALASVDVTLDMSRIRTTTEDVLPAASRSGLQAAGVIVRERETLRDAGGAESRATPAGSAQRDVEYAVGRRVEQVVGQPGSIRRIQVVAVVRRALQPAEIEPLRALVGAAVGAVPERGDEVVLHALAASGLAPPAGVAAPAEQGAAAAVAAHAQGPSEAVAQTTAAGLPNPIEAPAAQNGAASDAPPPAGSAARSPGAALLDARSARWLAAAAGAGVAALVVLAAAWGAARRRRARTAARAVPPALSPAEREAALRRLRDWMQLPEREPS